MIPGRPSKPLPLIDCLLAQNRFQSRKAAFAAILSGEIRVNGGIIRNPKLPVASDAVIEYQTERYVSRGGFKLEAALRAFRLNCNGKTVLDAGASTGGFTDCLLQHGASWVYAVDVGFNQLHFRLRSHPQVVVMERTNIKAVQTLSPLPDFAVADLSFRSVLPLLPHLFSLTVDKRLILLLKPQFEVDARCLSNFNGVIRDAAVHAKVAERFFLTVTAQGYRISGALPSPILGAHGNREFLIDVVENEGVPSLSLDGFLEQLELPHP